MSGNFSFHILDAVDSTNNYAMARVREGLASHGECWFALEQTAGRGQFGRTWESGKGENILLSCITAPPNFFSGQPFLYNMLIASVVQEFLQAFVSEEINIKWPNDLFAGDRKAGGILIENIFRGQIWTNSVVGVGINVNQQEFPPTGNCPISLSMLSGKTYDPVTMGEALARKIVSSVANCKPDDLSQIFSNYNARLYKLRQKISLKKQDSLIETTLMGVDYQGRLQTADNQTRTFMHGEVEWQLPANSSSK